jgi:uncharacterized membrane protein
MNESKAYQKIIEALKRRKSGVTIADISSSTALPLERIRCLMTKAADEFSGRLQVTQSGEILYSFPNGFKSRYRGLSAIIKKAGTILSRVSTFLFKVWIVVMLIGYFFLFLALALAAVFVSIAARSSDRDRGGGFGGFNIFGILWRIWFVSEITRSRGYEYETVSRNKEAKRPLHKAVFSFIFGEGDPNDEWEEQQNKAVISYIRANNGVISLAEYMVFSGKNSMEAEEEILAFCKKYAGIPHVTEEGTIVYHFEDLLPGADPKKFAGLLPPVKRLKIFSVNKKSMNGWFIVINAVNLVFGSYFLYHSLSAGHLITEIQYQSASYLYGFTHILLELVTQNPAVFMGMVLGFIPLLFSVLFWLIPALRYFREKNENEETKLSNFKRFCFSKIWSQPFNIDMGKFDHKEKEFRPKDMDIARDRVIKDMGSYSSPDIETSENGKMLYSFKGLELEKQALDKYRSSLDSMRTKLGLTIFDTGK